MFEDVGGVSDTRSGSLGEIEYGTLTFLKKKKVHIRT